jgi:hypothetical protein
MTRIHQVDNFGDKEHRVRKFTIIDAYHVEIDHSIKDIWSDLYLSRVKSIMGRAGVIANNLAIHTVDSNSIFHDHNFALQCFSAQPLCHSQSYACA